jgi:dienelactone hydrolase
MIWLAVAAALLWGDLKPGPYAVGFRTIYDVDASRQFGTTTGRPIRISIWYPATPNPASHPMRYGDYLHYDGPANFRDVDAALEKADRMLWLEDLNEVSPTGDAIAEKLFATPTAAIRDAPPAGGRFPLLLYSGGVASRADANVELGEFLASHGLVVATLPQLGRSRQEIDLGGSPADIELRARDYEFALAALRKLPEVDAARLATAGHSAGGNVALYLAMRNAEVRAVVGLDASYGFAGSAKRLESLPLFKATRLKVPLLDLRRANGVQAAKVDLGFIKRARFSDRYLVAFKDMFHGDFTEFGTIGLLMDVPLPPNTDGRTRKSAYEGNQRAYQATLDFLDAVLNGKTERLRRLRSDVEPAEFVHEAPRQ